MDKRSPGPTCKLDERQLPCKRGRRYGVGWYPRHAARLRFPSIFLAKKVNASSSTRSAGQASPAARRNQLKHQEYIHHEYTQSSQVPVVPAGHSGPSPSSWLISAPLHALRAADGVMSNGNSSKRGSSIYRLERRDAVMDLIVLPSNPSLKRHQCS